MLRLTLAQMRHSTGRLVAAGVAIVVGTAFIAATLVASAMIRDTTYAAMTAEIGNADVVAHAWGETPLSATDLDEVRNLDGVRAADGQLELSGTATAAGRQDWTAVAAVPAAGLTAPELLDGELPRATGQAALSTSTAKRLQVEVGDTVTLDATLWLPGPDGSIEDADGAVPSVTTELTLVGITTDPGALLSIGSQALVSAPQIDAWLTEVGRDAGFSQLLVVGDGSHSPEQLAGQVNDVLPAAEVLTGQQLAEQRTADLTGQNAVFTALVLAFGAVAMFVAAIVITNTFQVIVAQRTHTLALLRAVGASKRQVRRSVLVEALLLGTISGALGLFVGLALAQLALVVLGSRDLGIALPDTVSVSTAAIIVPIVTGAVVTWFAALAPARAATRVSPLAALRPPEPPNPRGASRLRLITSLLLVLVGGAMVVAGPLVAGNLSLDEDVAIYGGLLLGIGGGVISFAGIMLGIVFVAPLIVRVLGAITVRLGAGSTVRLATANATRNPRRTSATATALVIGVGLVTLMSTGAVTAQASLTSMLRGQFPVDLVVGSNSWEMDSGRTLPLTDAQLEAAYSSPGVATALDVHGGLTQVDAGGEMWSGIDVLGLEPDQAAEVLLDSSLVSDLDPTTVLLSSTMAKDLAVTVGDPVELMPAEDAGNSVELSAVIVDGLDQWAFVVTPGTLETLDPGAGVVAMWGRLDPSADAVETITGVQDRLTEADAAAPADAENTGEDAGQDAVSAYYSPPYVSGPAAERAAFEQIIDTLLAVVIGLLAVAVVIALIGVANTLSLSVIERRRESAVLRAIGLTRRQLRMMLAVEGTFLAVVGVLIGAVLGLLYGWAGSAILFGRTEGLALAVPWAHLAVIAVVAVLAGLLASVLPARSAVRTPPVAALAAD